MPYSVLQKAKARSLLPYPQSPLQSTHSKETKKQKQSASGPSTTSIVGAEHNIACRVCLRLRLPALSLLPSPEQDQRLHRFAFPYADWSAGSGGRSLLSSLPGRPTCLMTTYRIIATNAPTFKHPKHWMNCEEARAGGGVEERVARSSERGSARAGERVR